jgi:hypothetical protein
MKCFVIMPFGTDGTRAAEEYTEIYQGWIKPAVESIRTGEGERISCVRADEMLRPGEVMSQIVADLVEADLVIADLSDRNPNVFYELGVRHSVGGRTILLTQNVRDVPFDLRGFRLLTYKYTPRSLREFSSRLAEAIRETLLEEPTADTPIRRYLMARERDQALAGLSGAPPDVFREAIAEVQRLRDGLAAQVDGVRDLTESIVAWRRSAENGNPILRELEGHWTSVQHGGLFVFRVVRGELRVPYCYAESTHLDAHFYEVKLIGSRLVGRFRWFSDEESGFFLLRWMAPDRLSGGWWWAGAPALPEVLEFDPEGLSERHPHMNPITLIRAVTAGEDPEWARDYFAERAST